MTTFFRVLEANVEDKQALLRNSVAAVAAGITAGTGPARVFEMNPAVFRSVPRSPFAYWASKSLLAVFRRVPPLQAGDGSRKACAGAVTNDNARFVRLSWELANLLDWPCLAKGGAFSKFYSDLHLRLAWATDGIEVKAFVGDFRAAHGWSPHWAAELHNAEQYFLPGITWPLRTNGLSFRVLPRGCIFGSKGPAAFVESMRPDELLAIMALMNSSSFAYFVRLQLARTELAQSYEVGLIQQTPVPALSEEDIAGLALAVRRAWSLARSLDTTNETSHAFLLPQGPNERITGLDRAAAVREMEEIQRHIDDLAFDLYGIDTDDRALIQSARDGDAAISDDEDEDEDDDNGGHPGGGRVAQADTLISWFVGVAFGRFDIRLATEAHDLLPVGVMRDVPAEPEPFDPLPTRSPGMWPEGEPRVVTPPRIMVDDPHHNHDVWAHVAEVANQTGWPDPSNLRGWLAKEFFPLHIKMYSKSRRKAPIYWQLATPSASYSVWLYIHAFTKDTFFHVEDLVATKVLLEEGNTERLRDDAGDAPSAATRRALADQEAFLEELRGMLDEVRQVKPLWKPDLDDGVVINFAPLWRLVPQNKAWQRELKSTWDSLCAGEYDWAHLAMHLWPERVVPKCATDRSLAIAHGLEDEFWSEDSAGKWKAKATPTGPVKDLIAKRTSTAVSTARDSLIKALTPGGGAGGGRKRRAAPKARRRQ